MMACVLGVMKSHALDNLRKGRIKWRQKKKKQNSRDMNSNEVVAVST